ncbi:helix-turn-helix domain-containing protein [Fodinicola feengrottensis]|uniref:Helix-turn-helix domain-containing protein n=1 Tax=Fodinicola feengrottensis TaxID=435914 RepID=A0ABN2FS84_9ACTN
MPSAYDIYDPDCPSRQLLTLIAQRWSVLVLHALDEGVSRPADLGRRIGGISQKMLTQTLRDLIRAGLVDRTPYPEVPPRVEYTLTDAGREIAPLLAAICDWAEKHTATAISVAGTVEPPPT